MYAVEHVLMMQSDRSRKEKELQAELNRLAGVKVGSLATKQSKQEQIVSQDGLQSAARLEADIPAEQIK